MGTLAKNAILHGGNGDERIHPWILGMPDVWANTFHVLGDPDPHARIVKAVIVGGKCQKCALIAGNIGLGHHPKQLYIPYLSLHLPRNLRMACKMWGWLNLSSHHSWKKTSVLKRSLNQATIYIINYIYMCVHMYMYIYIDIRTKLERMRHEIIECGMTPSPIMNLPQNRSQNEKLQYQKDIRSDSQDQLPHVFLIV